MEPKKRGRRAFEPSTRDIRFACEKIQENWSSKERRKRAGHSEGKHWSPPFVEWASLLSEGANQTSDVPLV